MSKTLKVIILVIFVIMFIAVLGVISWIYWKNAHPKTTSTNNGNNQTQSAATNSSTNDASQEVAQNGSGWHIYKNFVHKFLIEYPDGAEVTNASTDENDMSLPANQSPCVEISTNYVTVKIAVRDIRDTSSCLNTGFGTEWSNAPDEDVSAAGTHYTAKGMFTEAASAGYYKDLYNFITMSDDRIEYGISVNEKYDNQMSKTQAKSLVHQIVASFSPAE